MRTTSRLFATVKSASRYLEGNTPTGLTGLPTHPAPRPALVYNYRTTLSKLQQLPPSSVYRQSAEALTQQRLKIVEDTLPEGYDAYLARVKKQIEDNPKAYSNLKTSDGSISYQALTVALSGPVPWDGTTRRQESESEGVNDLTGANRKISSTQSELDRQEREAKEGVQPTIDDLEVEPPLTADQISSIETQIGAGLIEEVVQVAEGELHLVDQMLKDQPWEPLEEQIPTGQWSYFERGDRV